MNIQTKLMFWALGVMRDQRDSTCWMCWKNKAQYLATTCNQCHDQFVEWKRRDNTAQALMQYLESPYLLSMPGDEFMNRLGYACQ